MKLSGIPAQSILVNCQQHKLKISWIRNSHLRQQGNFCEPPTASVRLNPYKIDQQCNFCWFFQKRKMNDPVNSLFDIKYIIIRYDVFANFGYRMIRMVTNVNKCCLSPTLYYRFRITIITITLPLPPVIKTVILQYPLFELSRTSSDDNHTR